jgi:hypothetical protein
MSGIPDPKPVTPSIAQVTFDFSLGVQSLGKADSILDQCDATFIGLELWSEDVTLHSDHDFYST